jgi:hypothetical protein
MRLYASSRTVYMWYIRMYVCMLYVCMLYVYVYIYIYIYIYNMYIYVYIRRPHHSPAYKFVHCICVCVLQNIMTCACMYICIYMYMQSLIRKRGMFHIAHILSSRHTYSAHDIHTQLTTYIRSSRHTYSAHDIHTQLVYLLFCISIQCMVLGLSLSSSSLYARTPGNATPNLRDVDVSWRRFAASHCWDVVG